MWIEELVSGLQASLAEQIPAEQEIKSAYKYRVLKRMARDAWLQVKDSSRDAWEALQYCLQHSSDDIQIIGVHLLMFYLKSEKDFRFSEFLHALLPITSWQVLDQAFRDYCSELAQIMTTQASLLEFIANQDFQELSPPLLRVFLSVLACAMDNDQLDSLHTTRVTEFLLENNDCKGLALKGVERYFQAMLHNEPSKFYAIYYSLQDSTQNMNKDLLRTLKGIMEKEQRADKEGKNMA